MTKFRVWLSAYVDLDYGDEEVSESKAVQDACESDGIDEVVGILGVEETTDQESTLHEKFLKFGWNSEECLLLVGRKAPDMVQEAVAETLRRCQEP